MLLTTAKNIAIISPPFIGHYQALINLAKQLIEVDKTLTFIITGWENVTLANIERNKIKSYGINLIEIYAEPIKIPAPFYFTFPRVNHLTDQVINACQQQDLLIYDYFSIEAYIAGKQLNIPSICSIAAITGPFYKNHPEFLQALAANTPDIQQLENKYQIDLAKKIEMLGDGFLLPSEHANLHWCWPSLLQADDYLNNRQLTNNLFRRPTSKPSSKKLTDKKLIYVSFGTVVIRHLWEHIPTLQEFIKNIFNSLIKNFGNQDNYEIIISVGRAVHDVLEKLPHNFYAYETVTQTEILQQADLFITHGGGNSVNEAIDNNVPMIVIPFFGDQHQSGKNVQQLNIGKAFLHEEIDQEKVIDAASGLYARKSLSNPQALTTAIIAVLHDSTFTENIKNLKILDKQRLLQDEKIS